jgi:hypothetical protein
METNFKIEDTISLHCCEKDKKIGKGILQTT